MRVLVGVWAASSMSVGLFYIEASREFALRYSEHTTIAWAIVTIGTYAYVMMNRRRKLDSTFSFKILPTWMRVLLWISIFHLFCRIAFVGFDAGKGTPHQLDDGRFVRMNKGEIIAEIEESKYFDSAVLGVIGLGAVPPFMIGILLSMHWISKLRELENGS